MQSPSKTRGGRAEDKITWWTTQAARLERDRTQLKWILVGGLPLVPPAFWYHWILGLAVLASVLATWGTGHYLVFVRRFEYRDNLREAHEELARVSTAEGATAPPA
jgi:hypothetical protein